MKKVCTRRHLIHKTAKAAMGAGLVSMLPGLENTSWAEEGKLQDEIPRRKLGKTGEEVTSIWLGGAHVAYVKDDSEADRLIHKAIDLGVTFLDTAWGYSEGLSERRLGKALSGGKRNKVFLMSKVPDRTADGARKQLEDSLRRLQTDYLDLWQFHALVRTEDVRECSVPAVHMRLQ